MNEATIKTLNADYIGKLDPATTGSEYSVFLPANQLAKTAIKLLERGYFIEDVSGLDTIEGLMAVYHFDHMDEPGRLTLRVLTSHDNPKIPSISNIFQGAEWHERETADFYGIEFTDITNDAPLLLPAEEPIEPPLVKTDKTRKAIKELIPAGEEIYKARDFDLFDVQEEQEKTEG